MKRYLIASTVSLALATTVGATAFSAERALGETSSETAAASGVDDADRGVRYVTIVSQLDDVCGIWINGARRGTLRPLGRTGYIPVGTPSVPAELFDRTNILLRCSDGGIYGTSVEGVYNQCTFVVDEEQGGIRSFCN